MLRPLPPPYLPSPGLCSPRGSPAPQRAGPARWAGAAELLLLLPMQGSRRPLTDRSA